LNRGLGINPPLQTISTGPAVNEETFDA